MKRKYQEVKDGDIALRVFYEEHPYNFNPREDDNLSTIAFFDTGYHRQGNLGDLDYNAYKGNPLMFMLDLANKSTNCEDLWESAQKAYDELQKDITIMPLFIEDDWNPTLYVEENNPNVWTKYNQVGWIYITPKNHKELNCCNLNIKKIILDELEEYNMYLQDEVFRAEIVKFAKCPCCGGQEEDILVDYYGMYFYGDDWEKNGLLQETPEQYRYLVDLLTQKDLCLTY